MALDLAASNELSLDDVAFNVVASARFSDVADTSDGHFKYPFLSPDIA